YDWATDVAVSVVGLQAWTATEVGKRGLAAESCRWCEQRTDGTPTTNALDEVARRALRWGATGTAEAISNALGYGATPLLLMAIGGGAALMDRRRRESPVDLLLFAETAVIAADVNQLVKFAVGRERPYLHFGALPVNASQQTDRFTSF